MFGSLVLAVVVPVFDGAVEVLVVVVVVVEAVFVGLLTVVLVVFVAVPPQPNEIIAKHMAIAIAIKLLNFIKLTFLTEVFVSRIAWCPERR